MIALFVVVLIVCALAMLLLVFGLIRRPRRNCGHSCTCISDESCPEQQSRD